MSAPPVAAAQVVGVILTHGQQEYGGRRRHEEVADTLTRWLGGLGCATIDLETRLDSRDWRLSTTADQLRSVLSRLDCVVTDPLHGLVLDVGELDRWWTWCLTDGRTAARSRQREFLAGSPRDGAEGLLDALHAVR
ncbi:hypothetical protein ACIBU0_01595 [Streptomyces sp. NPDC049627]|uniref:hypothetical protein n=1 Tax=Streptomyces sp. NPDC049627 TaxID=3365595 RepID=UPI0037A4703E